MRLTALLLSITLAGPAAMSLLCDWTCAVKHERTPAASAGCHDDGTSSSSSPTVTPSHKCHELAAGSESIVTAAPPAVLIPIAPVESSAAHPLTRASAGVAVRPPGVSHAPPIALTPLRI